MGLLSTIFGTGDVISKGIDLVDKMYTSKDEEIAAKAKAKADLLTAYAPFKIAQRCLALIFAITFVSSFFLCLGMALTGHGDIESVKSLLSDFYIGQIMLTIIVFYFGGGFVEGAINTAKKNKAP